MSKINNLKKAENIDAYKKLASQGLMLAHPVKINGESIRPDTGMGYHSTIKVFNKDKDHPHAIHNLAQHLPLNPPDAKNTQIEPDQFKDRFGNDVFVLKLKGNSADKIKEHNAKFSHMGDPTSYEFTPHISVPQALHDKIKASGAKTAHEAGIEFGPAELRAGHKALKTYHHEADSTEPKVPDHSDFTAKVKVPVSKSEQLNDLEKGQNGDWEKEGYKIHSLPHKEFVNKFPKYSNENSLMPHHIASPADKVHFAMSPQNKVIGHLAVKEHAEHLYPVDSQVDQNHQRKGIATAIYTNAEAHHKKPLIHSDNPADHSSDAKKLWSQSNRPFGKSESLYDLEKGALKNAALGAGMMAAAAGGASQVQASRMPPQVPQAPKVSQVAPEATQASPIPASKVSPIPKVKGPVVPKAGRSPASIPHKRPMAPAYDHKKMLEAIAQVESSNNPNVRHGEGGGAIHGHEHAYGRYGLMPETIRETIKAHPDLRQKYAKALALKGKQLHRFMHDNKDLDSVIADRHLSHMEHVLGRNPEPLGFGWLNGIEGTQKARKAGEDIHNHWHVRKIRDAYGKAK